MGELEEEKAAAGLNDIFIDPKNDIGLIFLGKVDEICKNKNSPTFDDDLVAAASGFLLELFSQREAYLQDMEGDMECWAVLFGHITGFAAIHAWGELQQLVGKHDEIMSLLIVIPAYLCMSGLFLGMDMIREHINTADDGIVDPREEAWDDVTEETENDVMALMMSFLCTQCIRQWISGALPNAEGIEKADQMRSHTVLQAVTLIGTGVGLMSWIGYRTVKYGDIKVEGEGLAVNFFNRLSEHNRLIVAMILAWTLYFGTTWAMAANFYGRVSDMMLEVSTTLVNSAMAFGLIYGFDKIQDSDSTDARVDIVLGKVITALSVLIGFAWEHCFDKATEVLAEKMPVNPNCYPKMGLAVVIGFIVIPAWRWYIVPLCIQLKEEAEEKEEEQMKELELQKDAEREADEQVNKWKRQGIDPLESREELFQALLQRKKKEQEEQEDEKSPFTSVERLKGMQHHNLVNLVAGLEKKTHKTNIDIKRFQHGQKAQIQRVQELERRNSELEDVIYGFYQETDELRKLVDRLTGATKR